MFDFCNKNWLIACGKRKLFIPFSPVGSLSIRVSSNTLIKSLFKTHWNDRLLATWHGAIPSLYFAVMPPEANCERNKKS